VVLQFGHLFARGETRVAAIRAMVVALKETKIRGEIRTNVDYSIDMLQASPFLNPEASTLNNLSTHSPTQGYHHRIVSLHHLSPVNYAARSQFDKATCSCVAGSIVQHGLLFFI
jgi:acetyl/propionyl-CoA carboxylase alpha subunit